MRCLRPPAPARRVRTMTHRFGFHCTSMPHSVPLPKVQGEGDRALQHISVAAVPRLLPHSLGAARLLLMAVLAPSLGPALPAATVVVAGTGFGA
jgi:hypothetical protein